MRFSRIKKVLIIVGAVISWFAVFAQFYLIIENRTVSVPEIILRFFGFFTILSNILVALYFTLSLTHRGIYLKKYFTVPSSATAIAIFICIVGLVYQLVLRKIWNPVGLQQLVDELLHSVIPLYYVLFWFFCINTGRLRSKSVFLWLLFPVFYLIYTMVRGQVSQYYPYPFLDVDELGFQKVMVNCSFLILLFVVMTILFLRISKYKARKWNILEK